MFKKTASCQGIDVPDLFDTSASLQVGRRAAERPALGNLWPAAAVAFLGLLVLAMLALTRGEGRGQYVVIAAPWMDRAGGCRRGSPRRGRAGRVGFPAQYCRRLVRE